MFITKLARKPSVFVLFTVLFTLTISFHLLFFVRQAQAQERIESSNYIIVFPNFNSGAGIPASDNYTLDTSLGQTAPGLFSSTGYRVKSGFQYIHSIIPFSFAISDLSISFGQLVADTFSTDTNTLTVSSGGADAYQVKALEDHPLQSSGSNQIPDTNCDISCSQTTAGLWTLTTSYGFGFNLSGNDIAADFSTANHFRQFADESSAEAAQTIMSSVNVGRNRQATVTYKVNVSDLQAGGIYNNIVRFIAIPGF